jgi:hypothetical protein
MIDAAKGTVVFDRGAIDARSKRRALLKSKLAQGATLDIENKEHRTYQLAEPLHLDEQLVSAQLYFKAESLKSISLAFGDKRFGTSWDDWSEAKERARQSAHLKWLRGFLDGKGPRWRFAWGIIESIYDQKSGGSSIEISYVAPT